MDLWTDYAEIPPEAHRAAEIDAEQPSRNAWSLPVLAAILGRWSIALLVGMYAVYGAALVVIVRALV